MKITHSLAAILALSSIAGFAFANHQQVPLPERCPSVSAIQAVGVSRNVIQGNNLVWYAGRRNQQYGTNNSWTFILGSIVAPTANTAYNNAVAGLTTLAFQLGPFKGPLDKWVCLYNTAQGYIGVTITTPIALTENTALQFINQ